MIFDYIVKIKRSNISLFTLIVLCNCIFNTNRIQGIWSCEVSLEPETGIGLGLNYQMEFTKDKQWIPNLGESFQTEYEIRENKIISKSKIGLSIYSTYNLSIDGDKLDIDTMGLKSYCVRSKTSK